MKNYFKIIILLLTIPFLSACGSSGYTNSFYSSSNSSSSSGYKSSLGNTYQYDLSNPVDKRKYQSDPKAKLRDRTTNQYMKALESILGQSGGGIFKKNNSPSWNNNMWNNNSNRYNPSKSFNNNAPTWDWVN